MVPFYLFPPSGSNSAMIEDPKGKTTPRTCIRYLYVPNWLYTPFGLCDPLLAFWPALVLWPLPSKWPSPAILVPPVINHCLLRNRCLAINFRLFTSSLWSCPPPGLVPPLILSTLWSCPLSDLVHPLVPPLFMNLKFLCRSCCHR